MRRLPSEPRTRSRRGVPPLRGLTRKERRERLPNPRAIVHATAEYGTYARTGGLAEAVAGLATAQARAGERVYVFMPLYPSVRAAMPDLEPAAPPLEVEVGGRLEEVRFFRATGADEWPRLLLVEAPAYFARENLYGEGDADYPDNHRRFALFSRAALEGVSLLVPGPVLFHVHDWHAALVPVYLRAAGVHAHTLGPSPVVISVHNAGYQGHFGAAALHDLGLPHWLWSLDWMEWYGRLNLLKGGIKLADAVVTVSPSHAEELRTPEGGFGLTDTFQLLGPRLVGICNGIDHDVWNPLTAPAIPARFGRSDLAGKAACKDAVQRAFGLARRPDIPLIVMAARLVRQKGFDIVLKSARVRSLDAQFVFLGTGDRGYQDALSALASERPQHVGVEFGFTDQLEHELLAGADIVLMPSQYEPCGLTQMHAQRYGSVVIARAVGGLRDTVEDGVTGFLFDEFDETALDAAIDRALALRARRRSWTAMMRRAMARDFSWTNALEAYGEVYATAGRLAAEAVA